MRTDKQKRADIIAGLVLFGTAVVIALIALCAKYAAIIDVGGDISPFSTETVICRTESETMAETRTENDTTTQVSTQADPFYSITDDQRKLIERVVMAEAGTEPGAGIIGVANCLYNAMLRCEGDPYAAVIEYGYTNARKTPNKDVREAVSTVFDRGELIFDDDVLVFCRSDCESAKTVWHSEQELVCTIGNHNFYRLKGGY